MKMFWGLILEPGKKYEHKSDASFHLTMAAIEPSDKTSSPNKPAINSVVVESSKTQYILCNLDQQNHIQQSLDCVFMQGEEVVFSVNGDHKVHLTGYVMPESDIEDFDESDDDDSEADMPLNNFGGVKRKEVEDDKKPKKSKLSDDMKAKLNQKNAKPNKGKANISQDLSDEEEDDSDDMGSDDMSDILNQLGDSDSEDDEFDDEESPKPKKSQKPANEKKKETPKVQQPQQNQKHPNQGKNKSPNTPNKLPFNQQSGGKKFNQNQSGNKKGGTPYNNNKNFGSGKKNKPWVKK